MDICLSGPKHSYFSLLFLRGVLAACRKHRERRLHPELQVAVCWVAKRACARVERLAAVACQVFKFSFLCARRLALLRSDAFVWQHRACPGRHGLVPTLWPLAARVGGDAALGCRAALSLQAYAWERALCRGLHGGRKHRALLADVKWKLEMRFLASYQCLLLCSSEGYRGAKDNPAESRSFNCFPIGIFHCGIRKL